MQHEERHDSNTKRVYFCHRCGNADQESKITGKSTYVSHCVDTHGIEDDVVEFFHFCDAENCMESFKIRDDFLEHLRSHWDMGVSLSCSICEKPFAGIDFLSSHIFSLNINYVVLILTFVSVMYRENQFGSP